MHLGPTSAFLAQVFNRPEPTLQMLGRLLRDSPDQWVKKGGRGRSGHHLESIELARFIVAFMACPDSPAQALDRLPHFAALLLDSDNGTSATFAEALAMLLERLATDDWASARERNWSVKIGIDLSTASITEDHDEEEDEDEDDKTIEHYFSSLVAANDDAPMIDALPYHGGLRCTVEIGWITLFRIAKVVLANEPDPHDVIIREILGEV